MDQTKETPEETNSSTYQLKPTNQSDSNPTLELNLMPFAITHSGETNITRYFLQTPLESDPETRTFSSSFRGRYLHGTSLSLPEGYHGTLMRTSTSSSSSNQVQVKRDPIVGRPSRSTGISGSKRHHKKAKLENKSVPHYEPEEEEAEEIIEGLIQPIHQDSSSKVSSTKTFELVGQFDRLTVWNPDGPLDLKEDCLMRGLSQYISLSKLIHTD